MELFLVEEAAVLYGGWVWAIMLAAYGLLVALIILLLRPRLVVYNITLEQLRPLLADVVARLDSEARWAGESLVMPQLGVQLHLEEAPFSKNVQLVSSGPQQNLPGWRQLEAELAAALRKARTGPNPSAYPARLRRPPRHRHHLARPRPRRRHASPERNAPPLTWGRPLACLH